MDTSVITYLVPVSGLLALGYAFTRARWVGRQDAGNERMAEIAAAISEGARAFLSREYRVLAVFVVSVAALLAAVNLNNAQSSPLVNATTRLSDVLTMARRPAVHTMPSWLGTASGSVTSVAAAGSSSGTFQSAAPRATRR